MWFFSDFLGLFQWILNDSSTVPQWVLMDLESALSRCTFAMSTNDKRSLKHCDTFYI